MVLLDHVRIDLFKKSRYLTWYLYLGHVVVDSKDFESILFIYSINFTPKEVSFNGLLYYRFIIPSFSYKKLHHSAYKAYLYFLQQQKSKTSLLFFKTSYKRRFLIYLIWS